MAREKKSRMMKASGRTFFRGKKISCREKADLSTSILRRRPFFNLKETQEGKKYLLLTESRRTKDGEEFLRSTIILFPENAQEFGDAVGEMTAKLA